MERFKSIVCCLLIACLLLPFSAGLAEETDFSVSQFAGNPDQYEIEIDSDDDLAFIVSTLPGEDLCFSHKYESTESYSIIYNDILVLDYSTSGFFPLLRTVVSVSSEKPLDITSVSFVVKHKTFTFTGFEPSEGTIKHENDYEQNLCIDYGKDNVDFWALIFSYALSYASTKKEDEYGTCPFSMKMVLHGTEDMEADVPAAFWDDLALFAVPFYENDMAWLDKYVTKNDGDPCTVE